MAIKKDILGKINLVAETQFFIKPVLVNYLKNYQFNAEGQKFTNGAKTYYELWTNSLSEKFYDMGNLIRLGTELELGLKYYYMEKKGHRNLIDLEQDSKYQTNIFQRIMPWTKNSAINIYQDELQYDLNTNPKFAEMQEIMLYRHLYAHNSGLLNDKFITDYNKLTQKNISDYPETNTYPQEDTYFFTPLNQLNKFIEDTRAFFTEFP